jgi:pantetheine-phosphate adenylyltransferase
MTLALYPGSFDPFTLGHLDILERAQRLFEQVEVAVGINAGKKTLFSVDERCEMIRRSAARLDGVTVSSFDGLIAEYARERGAVALIRGLRNLSDFDYEMSMASANRQLNSGLETVMLPPSPAFAHISATIVRDVQRWGGDVRSFVPPPVAAALEALRK